MFRSISATALSLFLAAIAYGDTASSPAPPPTEQAGPAPFLTTTFWNVQWFPGRRPNASRAEEIRQTRLVQREIAQLPSDIIGLEEVRDFEHAGIAVKPLAGFKVDVCSNFPPREGQTVAQQVAIASRLPAMSAWAESWKSGAAITPPRGFAFAAYQIAAKRVLLVYALHLKSNRGQLTEDMRIREESIHQLTSHMSAMEAAYGKLGALTWIIGGDFNTAPDDQRFRGERTVPELLAHGFNWAWRGVPFESRITMPPDARFPAACFDQIFFRGCTLTKAWVANTTTQTSDHRAVNLTLAWPP